MSEVYRITSQNNLESDLQAALEQRKLLGEEFGYMPLAPHVASEPAAPGKRLFRREGLYDVSEHVELLETLRKSSQTGFSGTSVCALAVYERAKLVEADLNGKGMPISFQDQSNKPTALRAVLLVQYKDRAAR